MKLLLVAVAMSSVACASAAPEAPATVTSVPAASANASLSIYEGTYALQGSNRVINLRVWLDAEGKMNGELVGTGNATIFRADSPHKFLHGNADDIWVVFNIENGRAASATMHQRGREISGPRISASATSIHEATYVQGFRSHTSARALLQVRSMPLFVDDGG